MLNAVAKILCIGWRMTVWAAEQQERSSALPHEVNRSNWYVQNA